MMKAKILVLIGILAGLTSFTGCGTNDPLSTLGGASAPLLDPIFIPGSAQFPGSGFSSGHPYWEFTSGGFFFGGNVLAPANGLVSSMGLDSTSGSSYVTLAHAGRLATRIAGVVPTVRSGDMVIAGQVIGTFVGSGAISFQVLLNGAPVCPLSFISSSFRSQIITYFAAAASLCL
jgi:hypothetical protein